MGERDIIFLLGAGASVMVDLPLMKELWERYVDKTSYKSHESMKTLRSVMIKEYGIEDIENFLTLISELSDKINSKRLQTIYPDLTRITNLDDIKSDVEHCIRTSLENIDSDSTNYYKPLLSICSDKSKIFSLNYDGLIEILCEHNKIKCSDGFDPEWNPENFNDVQFQVQLYKLHGSLFWLRNSSVKYFKVPLKGISPHVKYMSDDDLSEMIIYPSMNKNKYTEIYSWLHNKFINELKNTRVCIIIGYSFRDDDISDVIIDILNNHFIFLVLISPNASNTKRFLIEKYSLNTDSETRIIPINDGVEIITKRHLNKKIPTLLDNISDEVVTFKSQDSQDGLIDAWSKLFESYKIMNYHDRIRYILEVLSDRSIVPWSSGNVERKNYLLFIDFFNSSVTEGKKKEIEIWERYLLDFFEAIDCYMLKVLGIDIGIKPYTNQNFEFKNDDVVELTNKLKGLKTYQDFTFKNLLQFLDSIVAANIRNSGSPVNVNLLSTIYDKNNLKQLARKWFESIEIVDKKAKVNS